jgi:heme exporter protein A
MLTVQNLSCRRGSRVIFRNVKLTATQGDFFLVTGANGSGKSSLLRVIAGFISPIAGEVLWNNITIRDDLPLHRANVHYIGHLDAVKSELNVQEMLNYWCTLKGVREKKEAHILDAFALSYLSSRTVRTLSAGQKRRLSLTRLILDYKPLWILDEPTTSLDEAGQKLLWEKVEHYRAQGGIVIAAMHDEPKIRDMQRIEMDNP